MGFHYGNNWCKWTEALNGFASGGRVGDSHLNVPGHDGVGYGGTCFQGYQYYFIILKPWD